MSKLLNNADLTGETPKVEMEAGDRIKPDGWAVAGKLLGSDWSEADWRLDPGGAPPLRAGRQRQLVRSDDSVRRSVHWARCPSRNRVGAGRPRERNQPRLAVAGACEGHMTGPAIPCEAKRYGGVERAYIRDLIIDIRCAERDGLPEYADRCRRLLSKAWPKRCSP